LQLASQTARLANAANLEQQLVDIERLGQVVTGAFFERQDRMGDIHMGGHHDDVGVRRRGPDAPQNRQSIDPGEANVADDQVERLAGQMVDRDLPISGSSSARRMFSTGTFQTRRRYDIVTSAGSCHHRRSTFAGSRQYGASQNVYIKKRAELPAASRRGRKGRLQPRPTGEGTAGRVRRRSTVTKTVAALPVRTADSGIQPTAPVKPLPIMLDKTALPAIVTTP
jgi:hypothetical protein